MKKIFSILFLILSLNSFGHFTVTKNCKVAYRYIFNLEFEKGQQLLNIEKVVDPKNSIPYLYENYIDFLKILLGENRNDFENLETNKNKRLAIIEKDDKSSPYYLYSQAEMNFQWAFARLKFREFFTAAYELRKSFKLLEENREKFPDFEPNNKLLGFFHAFIGGIPEEYMWIVKFAGFSGTIDQGIDELYSFLQATKSNSEYSHLRDEALALLATTQINVQFDPNKIEKTLKCYDDITDANVLLQYSKAVILGRLARTDETIKTLEAIKLTDNQYPLHSLNYALGTAKLKRLDDDAIVYLKKYVQNFEGTTYIKSSYLKIAWYYLLAENEDKYWENLNYCITKGGDAYLDEDKYALNYAKTKQISDVTLLKARLLFDGGKYKEALHLLESGKAKIPKTNYNNMEFLYRKGRCYQKLKEYNNAIKYYKETIKESVNSTLFFGCKSALEIGKCYEELKDCKNAIIYYEKSKAIPSDEYKSSFTQQAKAGIRRVNEKCN